MTSVWQCCVPGWIRALSFTAERAYHLLAEAGLRGSDSLN